MTRFDMRPEWDSPVIFHTSCERHVDVDRAPVHLTLTIRNFMEIARAYGVDAARDVQSELQRMAQHALGMEGTTSSRNPGLIELRIMDPAFLGAPARSDRRLAFALFCQELMLLPVRTAAGRVHARLIGEWPIIQESHHAHDGGFNLSHESAAEPSDDWPARYRSDMDFVSAFLGLLTGQWGASSGGAASADLAWQAVRHAREPSSILYCEALLRVVERDGAARPMGDTFLALERLGFAPLADRIIVQKVLDELSASPDLMLGVNISAQSARMDSWWEAVEQRLCRDRDLAARLVIEITETAPFPRIDEAVRFTRRLRRAGCVIAVDDFGAGYASVRHLTALSPAIVKIDRLFLRRARSSDKARAMFDHLVGVARAIGAVVVAEGVEHEADAQVAIEAGIEWLQGYHYGKPSLSRPERGGRQCQPQRSNGFGR